MSEEPPSSQNTKERPHERSWLDRLLNSFSNNEPQSREELLAIIKEAASNKLLDPGVLEIIEGALSVSNLQVREIMIPRSQMVVIKQDETPAPRLLYTADELRQIHKLQAIAHVEREELNKS